jgi:hypothetical protein
MGRLRDVCLATAIVMALACWGKSLQSSKCDPGDARFDHAYEHKVLSGEWESLPIIDHPEAYDQGSVKR